MPRRLVDGLSRQPRARLALAAALAAAPALAGCPSTTGTAGCEIDRQVTLAASPLGLLPNVRLDRVGEGFMLSGVEPDRITVRWQSVDEAGAAGQEQRMVLGAAAGGPWLAFTGDTLLVAQAHAAANGTDAELRIVAVPATGAPTPPPGPSVAVVAGGLAGAAALPVAFGASRTGGHATLAWTDAKGVQLLTLTAAGTPVGAAQSLDDVVAPVSCLGFIPGKNAATLTYYRHPDPKVTSPELVIAELDEAGSLMGTLSLFLDSHDAGCPRVMSTPTGYALAFEDGQGGWLGVYETATNRINLVPFSSAVAFPGGLQPPLMGLSAVADGYAVVVQRSRTGELWRLDGQGHRRPGALLFPSMQGAIGDISTWSGGGSLWATYADYNSVEAGVGVEGQRLLVRATCP